MPNLPAVRSGLHEMGLPYVNDPGIMRHLAAFLRRHASTTPGTDEAPAAILFNGGVFQPEISAPSARHRHATMVRSCRASLGTCAC